MKLKNHSNMAKAGYVVGSLTSVSAFLFLIFWGVRYFFTYPDINIAVLGVLLAVMGFSFGLLVLFISWIYSKMISVAGALDYLEGKLQEKFEE